MSTNIEHSGIQPTELFPPEPPAYESIDHTSVSQGIYTLYLMGFYFDGLHTYLYIIYCI